MSERRVKVTRDGGLHDGIAVQLVQLAARAEEPVTIGRDDDSDPVSARSALSVLGLDIAAGENIILASDDESALDKLSELVT